MKRALFLTMTLMLSCALFSQGYIDVSGNWYSYQYPNPRVFSSDIRVPAGSVLNIYSGVEILFDGDYEFLVEGQLNALGMISSPISISAIDGNTDGWKGIRFSNTSDCSLNYVKVSRANSGTAIMIYGCDDIEIKHCELFNNIYTNTSLYASAFVFHAINSTGLSIQNNTIRNNRQRGDDSFISVVKIENCRNSDFNHNIIRNNSAEYIVLFDNINGHPGSFINIIGNTVNGNNCKMSTFEVRNYEDHAWISSRGIDCYLVKSNNISNNRRDINALPIEMTTAGLSVIGENIVVSDNIITYNKNSVNGGGLTISVLDTILVKGNQIRNNEAVEGGGMYIRQYYDTYILPTSIEYNEIYYNTAVKGGGIAIQNGNIDINDPCANISFTRNAIALNTAEYGAGIYLKDSSIALINNTLAFNWGQAIYTEREYSTLIDSKDILLINNILWGYDPPYTIETADPVADDLLYIRNSTVQNGNNAINITNTDILTQYTYNPMFIDQYYPDLNIGNALYATLPGLGGDFADFVGLYPYDSSYPASYHQRQFKAGWNWISFPKLPRFDPDDNTEVEFKMIGELFRPRVIQIEAFEETAIWDDNTGWDNLLRDIQSTMGYRVELSAEHSYVKQGTTLHPQTTIDLVRGENWVGYFLPYTQTIEDALRHLDWSNVVYVKGYDGSIWTYSPFMLMSDVPKYIRFGDMVIICAIDHFSFVWHQGPVANPSPVQSVELFSYEELADYTPIFIEMDTDNPPAEIAAFIDGVCVGATLYEGEISEIRAYLDAADLNQEIEIVFGYNTRAPNETISEYAVKNHHTQSFDYVPLIARAGVGYYHIKITDPEKTNIEIPQPFIQLQQNYPNPFNPETQIDFYLSADSYVQLSIYNIRGQKVKDLVVENLKAGRHSAVWNGLDSNQRQVSSGIYLYRLHTSHGTIHKRMVLIK